MPSLGHLAAHSLFNLKGWVTVVTGGGTGLGLMTAKALAANGAKVYVTGGRAAKMQDAELQDADSGGSITGLQMDCTDKQSIQESVKAIAGKEKFINLLVNNAGITSVNYGSAGMPKGDVKAVSEAMMNNQTFDDWTNVYKINVASYYFTSVAFLPLLTATKNHGYGVSGSIINVSSISGITKESQNGQFSYNASKAATISLTQQLAVDFKRPDLEIRVNTIAPGYFPSEMTDTDSDMGKEKEHFRTKWGVPFGRAGHPKDYAQAVLNFATNEHVLQHSSSLILADDNADIPQDPH